MPVMSLCVIPSRYPCRQDAIARESSQGNPTNLIWPKSITNASPSAWHLLSVKRWLASATKIMWNLLTSRKGPAKVTKTGKVSKALRCCQLFFFRSKITWLSWGQKNSPSARPHIAENLLGLQWRLSVMQTSHITLLICAPCSSQQLPVQCLHVSFVGFWWRKSWTWFQANLRSWNSKH